MLLYLCIISLKKRSQGLFCIVICAVKDHFYYKNVQVLLDKFYFLRSELADFEEQQEQKLMMIAEEKERKRLEQWARKHHHLISTEVQPGIYNSPFQPYVLPAK